MEPQQPLRLFSMTLLSLVFLPSVKFVVVGFFFLQFVSLTVVIRLARQMKLDKIHSHLAITLAAFLL